MPVETINIARKMAKSQLPADVNRDWRAFDDRVYKGMRDLELMRKLSDQENGVVSDLMLLEFMGLADEYRHVLRLSILQLTQDGLLKRRQGTQTWTCLVTTHRWGIMEQSQKAKEEAWRRQLLKS